MKKLCSFICGKAVRLASGTIAVALVVSACSGPAKSGDAEAAPPAISIMVPLHQPQPPNAEMIELLEKGTGAKLAVDWISSDNYTEKLVNALETNTLKQVTAVADTDYVLVKNSIRSGMFWEIGPYLDDYPNLRKLKMNVLQETAVDGKIYGLYSERPPSRQGLIIRKDWLDNLGMKPPGSLDELYRMLLRFTQGDPDGDGKADTIGLADRNDLIFGAFKTFASYFGTPNNWIVENGALKPEFMAQEYVDTMNFMKKLVDDGLINPDFPVTSKQIQRYMFMNGKAGAIVGAMDDAQRLQDEMKKIDGRAELTIANRIRGPKGYGIWTIPDYSAVFLFSTRTVKTEADLRRILQFFDRSMETDTGNLLKYGIPGKHYTIRDGKALLNPVNEMRNKDVLPLYSLMIANLNNPNLLRLDTSDQEQLNVQANLLIADNESFQIRDPALGLGSTTFDSKGAALAQAISYATYNYMLGRIDLGGFQKEIAAWKANGGDAIIHEFNLAYNNKIR